MSAAGPPPVEHGSLSDALEKVITSICEELQAVPFQEPPRETASWASGNYYDTQDVVNGHFAAAATAANDMCSLQESSIGYLTTLSENLFKIYCSAAETLISASGTASTSSVVDNLPGCDLLEIICAIAYRGEVVPVVGNQGDGGIDVAVPKAGPGSTHLIQCKLGPSGRKKTRSNLLSLIGAFGYPCC
jgi:hypothetical protein